MIAEDTMVYSDGDDEDETKRIRKALETVSMISVLLGGLPITPTTTSRRKPSIAEDSVAAWSTTMVEGNHTEHPLSDPTDCPPFTDPSSVLIANPRTLDYELESISEATPLVTGNSSMDGKLTVTSAASHRAVRFMDKVECLDIPSHRDMDPATKQLIWSSSDQVHMNAQRNSMEYHSEGRNWMKATEEEDMILDDVTGEYVHPATWDELQLERYQHAMAKQQREDRVRAIRAQQQEQQRTSPTMKKRRKRPVQQRSSPDADRLRDLRALQHTAAAVASLTRFADT